jgi:hypothetical protein
MTCWAGWSCQTCGLGQVVEGGQFGQLERDQAGEMFGCFKTQTQTQRHTDTRPGRGLCSWQSNNCCSVLAGLEQAGRGKKKRCRWWWREAVDGRQSEDGWMDGWVVYGSRNVKRAQESE